MADETLSIDQQQLEAAVKSILEAMAVEHQPLPVPQPSVPEVLIRIGSPEQLYALLPILGCCCPCPCAPSCRDWRDSYIPTVLEGLEGKTGIPRDAIVEGAKRTIIDRYLEDEIKALADTLGVPTVPPSP